MYTFQSCLSCRCILSRNSRRRIVYFVTLPHEHHLTRCDMVPFPQAVNGEKMSITCALLEYDPGIVEGNSTVTTVERSVFPVIFQLPSTAEYLTCSTSRIQVESVRWPHTRFTAPERPALPLLNLLKGSSCMDTGTCGTIDAAIWVTPLCGGSFIPPRCIEIFAKSACYPFCLAVRQTNTFNSAMRLYNQPDWLDSVHIFNRDCVVHQYTKQGANANGFSVQVQEYIQAVEGGASLTELYNLLNYGSLVSSVVSSLSSTSQTAARPGYYYATSTLSNDLMGSTVVSEQPYSEGPKCVPALYTTSTIPKYFFETNGDYGEESFRSTLGSDQPFVYAGDTVLTSDCHAQNIQYTAFSCKIFVYRIYGGDANQMTLVNTNNALPAFAPPMTVEMMAETVQRSHDAVMVPYSLTNSPWTQNPAVATEDAIFYSVNPYWQIFTAFIGYCNNNVFDSDENNKFQLQVISSWSPITIFRVYPYVYCPPSKIGGCYENLFSGIQLPKSIPLSDSTDSCKTMIDFIVTGMEYIDHENIAVSVLRTHPEYINPATMQPFFKDDGVTHTVTYFLNTITMQIRENQAWSTEVPQAVQSQGQLCPAQRRMPQFGSLVTEAISASILFIRMPFNIILNGVYIFDRWTQERGDECPLITRGMFSCVIDHCV